LIYEKLTQYGPFPIRIIAGIAFILHGLPKLSNLPGTEDFFANMVGLPPTLALPVGLLEVIGGIVLLVGFLTRIASILFII
jgi:putative oxidoreductase